MLFKRRSDETVSDENVWFVWVRKEDAKMLVWRKDLRELGNLNMRRVELRRDYRNAQIEYRHTMDRYDKRCIECNYTFREVFGPAVMIHVLSIALIIIDTIQV